MTSKLKTQVLIIGSGTAGLSAAIYAARAALEPMLLHGMQPGGQLTITTDVENYPGFADAVQGPWLMEQMTKQAEKFGVQIFHEYAEKVQLTKSPFIVATNNSLFEAESIIICTGAQAKWLGLPSERAFQGFGVSGCATCDGFFFKKKPVIVVGGGNTAIEEALHLAKFASSVTVIHRRDSLRAEKILQKRLFENPKISVIWDSVVQEIIGNDNPKAVTGVKVQNVNNKEHSTYIECEGVFIAIGHTPNTELFRNQIKMDEEGYIITAPYSTKTNIDGVFAAGDVQDRIFRQAITAAGTGCMAALEAEKFLSSY